MITQYEGYSSFNQDISDTQQYQAHQHLSQDLQKPNRHNQTYQEAPNFPLCDALQEITNKIKISEAISKNLYQCPNQPEPIKKYQPITSRKSVKHLPIKSSIPHTSRISNTSKPPDSSRQSNPSRPIHQSKLHDKRQNLPLQIQNKKSRSRSLLYFQQNQPITQNVKPKNSPKIFSKQQIDFPLQQKKCIKLQQQSLTQTYYLPITQQPNNTQKQKPKYFAKNQQKSINTKRQILLTSRSGYNMSISGVFLENITKQYENHNPNKQNQVSLKQKIELKIIKNKQKRIKTQFQSQHDLKVHKIQVSKLYRPMNPLEAQNQRIILSTEPFENRQQKTLENRRNKVELLKRKKRQAEIKQCTFKPKTNISKNNKIAK